jgi:hypothetical protein
MKTTLTASAIAIAAIIAALALSSCSHLAGSSIVFDDKGNMIIVPALKPTVIEAVDSTK